MRPPKTYSAHHLLDEILHLPQLVSFSPERFTILLVEEVSDGIKTDPDPEELKRHLDGLLVLLGEVERFTQKAMGIRLNHALSEAPVTPQFRTLLTATVTAYAADISVLRERIVASLRGITQERAQEIADQVERAASEVLHLRQSLRGGIEQTVRMLCEKSLPCARRRANDRLLPDKERHAYKLLREDLEHLAQRPRAIVEKPQGYDERIKQYIPREDPVEDPQVQGERFSLLEID